MVVPRRMSPDLVELNAQNASALSWHNCYGTVKRIGSTLLQGESAARRCGSWQVQLEVD